FTLSEYRSVPEKVEQRQPKKAPKKQQADGNSIPPNGQTKTEANTQKEPELTAFEQYLKEIDEAIGPSETEQRADNQSADSTAGTA
ncbi:hypothetical protein, partial [Zooshikella ganghwensis]|uniref:baseplate complex protein n=1 Tax=Zooshikella ganghwensis TaxID=202772 RepID=UPI00056E536F